MLTPFGVRHHDEMPVANPSLEAHDQIWAQFEQRKQRTVQQMRMHLAAQAYPYNSSKQNGHNYFPHKSGRHNHRSNNFNQVQTNAPHGGLRPVKQPQEKVTTPQGAWNKEES